MKIEGTAKEIADFVFQLQKSTKPNHCCHGDYDVKQGEKMTNPLIEN